MNAAATPRTEPPSEDYDEVLPEPSALVESLRAFGYSLRTAIADLVDNSISAEAKNIWIRFEWDGAHSFISVRDDGIGMTESELIAAMRPGSKNPLDSRKPGDLGRFGLGLKTASFSQCRRLSVFSITETSPLTARCWDLDYIRDSEKWYLLKKVNAEHPALEDLENAPQGTVILWEKMDRITGSTDINDMKACQRFLTVAEEVKKHLAMVFHRFLEKQNGIRIFINDRQIEAWDPFLKNRYATQEQPTEKLFYREMMLTVTPFILPHQSKLPQNIHQTAAGPQGWNGQQGFYIYRNERLLVAGGWLGLGFQKEEHHKLARIRVDLPNSMDGVWQIDVMKSKARPPGELHDDLKRIAGATRKRAVQVYRHRGKFTTRKSSPEHMFLWQQGTRHGKYFYSINRKHPLIQSLFHEVDTGKLEPLLRMLEETVPLSHIIITSSEEPEKMAEPFEKANYAEIQPILSAVYQSFQKNGLSRNEIFERLLTMEPFAEIPEFVQKFKEKTEGDI